jgi:molybdopterin synthase catalytic subunit
MSKLKIPKKVFMQGGIPAAFIGQSIAKHQSKTDIGAHNIFLGQVRADVIEDKTVRAIEYTTYEEMATEQLHQIREATFERFPITCMHIHHSLGEVGAGEICLFVFVSSPHRAVCYEASRYIVEAIKKEVPIFGKEIFEDDSHQWKKNVL